MAYGLAAADLNGTSDPYVLVQCGGQKRKTRVIMKQLAPVWNETLHFRGELDDFLASGVHFELYDHDEVGSDDSLGEIKHKLEQELRMQTSVEVREYVERLTPEGHIVFKVAWLPETDAASDAHAASRGQLVNHPADVTADAASPGSQGSPGSSVLTPGSPGAEVVSRRDVKPPKAVQRPTSAASKDRGFKGGLGHLVPKDKPVMIPVLLPHKFDYVQLTYERFAQAEQLKNAERERLQRLRAPIRTTTGQAVRSLHGSSSTPALVRPPSSDLFVNDAFRHAAMVKMRKDGDQDFAGRTKFGSQKLSTFSIPHPTTPAAQKQKNSRHDLLG